MDQYNWIAMGYLNEWTHEYYSFDGVIHSLQALLEINNYKPASQTFT